MPARKQNCVWLYLKINKSTCISQKLARMPCEMLITWKRYAGHSCSNETTPQMHGSHCIGLHCMGCTAWGCTAWICTAWGCTTWGCTAWDCITWGCIAWVALYKFNVFLFGGGGGGNPIESWTRLSN